MPRTTGRTTAGARRPEHGTSWNSRRGGSRVASRAGASAVAETDTTTESRSAVRVYPEASRPTGHGARHQAHQRQGARRRRRQAEDHDPSGSVVSSSSARGGPNPYSASTARPSSPATRSMNARASSSWSSRRRHDRKDGHDVHVVGDARPADRRAAAETSDVDDRRVGLACRHLPRRSRCPRSTRGCPAPRRSRRSRVPPARSHRRGRLRRRARAVRPIARSSSTPPPRGCRGG
jgi:hypothetical protein